MNSLRRRSVCRADCAGGGPEETWYRERAEQGDAEAQNRLGVMYRDGEGVPEDDAQAYAWFNLSGEWGTRRLGESANASLRK